jgi:uncharacterized integral membrane protein
MSTEGDNAPPARPAEPAAPAAGDDTEPTPAAPRVAGKDPLRGSRTSGIWIATAGLALLLVLLAVFVLQNTQEVRVSFFGWDTHAPLAATLLIATAAGAAIVLVAGSLRILQLRRRVRRARKP